MKSAYEIAMERLAKEAGPARELSAADKQAIADIDRKFDARVAETKLSFETRLKAAPPAEMEAIQQALTDDLRRLEEQRDREKDAVWAQGSAGGAG